MGLGRKPGWHPSCSHGPRMSGLGHEQEKTDYLRFVRSPLDSRLNFAESGHRNPVQIRVLQKPQLQAEMNGY